MLTKNNVRNIYRLSPMQEGMFFQSLYDESSTAYLLQSSYHIKGDLKVKLLEKSLNELFKRYDILRTVFIQKVDKKLFQVVLKDRKIPFFYEDISKREDKEDYLLRFKEADIKKVFDLSKDVLMRASLFQLDTSQYEFIWTFHHILMDGWCMSVLIPELIEVYNSFVEGRTYRLSETRQYREYIQWLENQDREAARNYWQKYLEDYEGMASIVGAKNYDLPNTEYRINKYTFNISTEKTRILENIAGNIQVTLNTLIQTTWGILLGRYNNKQDVALGVVVSGRPAGVQQIETMIGLFINTIPVRIRFDEKATFNELLKQVQEQSVASERYHFFPLAEILALSQQKKNLFDHIMGYENFPSTEQIEGIADRNKELKLEVHRTGIFEQSPYDFNIGIGRGDQLSLFFLYNEAKFEDTFIKRVANHLCSLFDQIILCYNANPDFTMEELTWLSPTEKQKILFQFNATAADFPKDKRLHELFEMQVDQNPDSTALIFEDEYLTYRELNHQANRLKMVLSAKGLQPQGIASLLMKRSTEMVMGILAILKAGAVYLPIDVETPGKRVEYMLNDTNARVLLTDSRVIKDYSFIDLIGLNVPGKNLHIHRTEVRKQIKNPEEILPIPDRSLISYEKYSSDIGFAMAKHAIAIQATRGCPYKCVYCHKIWPKTHVARSAEHIFEEVQLLYNMGVRRFVFIDDIFNLKKENSERFFKLILKHKMKLQLFFSNGMRGDILTKDYIDLMVEAGTVDLALAMETASPRLQKLIGKNLDLDKLHENMDYICQKHPYVISELFSMHGFPTETESEAQSTMDFIKSFRWLHLPQAHILKIYPNTDMADIAIKNGISQEAIDRSENLAFHQLPETLPFDKSFTRRYQADYLDYILSKERLLHVLPYQMKILTEDELLQKYNSFLPTKINCLQDLCQLAGISPEEFGPLDFLPADHMKVSDFDPKLEQHFKPLTPPKEKDALRIMLMDVSQFFSGEFDMLYDVSEPPLGLMYLLTYLNKIYGSRVKGKVIKSRIDFDNFEQLKALMEEFRPEIIGIRSLTFFNQFFHKTTTMIREWGFNGLVIAGGPYATSDYKRILRDRNVDLVVLGEGEITFGELIGEIMANGGRLPGEDTLEKIPGIAYAKRETHPMRKNVFDREVIFCDHLDLAASKPSIPERNSSDHLTHVGRPSDISYVIYTSGTTGRPKGVPIQHRNVVRLMLNDRFQFDFNSADVWTMFHSYSFDFSVWEMYGALLYGGKLVVVPDMVARDPHRFLDLLKKYRVTVLNQTPSAFYQLSEEDTRHENCRLNLAYIIFGGEALKPFKLKHWQEKYPRTELINMFGITETTVHVTYKEITRKEIDFNQSNIGRPIPTMKLFVLGRNLELLPIGVPGELFIEGDGVASGYLNQPELSQQKFVENPFIPGDRLYRSGDAGRVLDNGDIEYLGRIDNQIQLRGFRVELGEIENQLLKHKDIRDAVVVACEDKTGYNYLCGYIVSARPLKVSDLRDFLAQKLPHYMIPGYYVELEKIPLTTNGKVDIKALPEPEAMGGEGDTLPRNEIDEAISGIWKRELGLKKVSINDSFFNLGGDSIKAINLLNSINNALDSKLKIEDIFTYETIEKLSDHVYASSSPYRYDEAQQSREAVIREFEVLKNRVLSLHPRTNEIEDIFPMSDIQKGIVFYSVRNSSQAIYFDQFIDQLKYPNFDLGIFKKALTLLVDKHPILRTSFNWTDFDEPVQIVYKASAVEFEIRFINLSNMKHSQQEAFIKELMEKERREPFDLSVPPLMRSVVLALGYDRLFFLWDIHHAISDGWSHASLMTEINNTYLSLKTDAHFLPERLQSSYKDYVIEQVQVKRNNRIIEFWKKELEDYKRIDFSLYKYDTPVKQDDSRRPRDVYSLDFETDYWTQLQEISHRYEISIKNLCFGAYLYMLSKLLYENDILVGLITHNRPVSKDGEKIMGCFLNTVPVRVRIPGGLSWAEYIKFINRKLITLKTFDKLSFFEIVRQINEKTQENNPLFDTVFNFVDFHVYNQLKPLDVSDTQENEEDDEGSEKVSIEKYEVSNTLFDFHVNASPGSYRIDILYSNLIFSAHQVETLGGYFKCALDNMIYNTDGILSKDASISAAERKKLLEEFNNTSTDFKGDRTLYRLFEEQADRRPDGIALVSSAYIEEGETREQHISYRELSETSGRLAVFLRKGGLHAGVIAAVIVDRSLEMIIGIMGILKAGGAYLPIDPKYPVERIQYMLSDSGTNVLVTTSNLSEDLKIGRWEGKKIFPEEFLDRTPVSSVSPVAKPPPQPLNWSEGHHIHHSSLITHHSKNLVYVIYTSGSTGRPKGVMVEHRSVINRLNWMQRSYPLDHRDFILQKTPIIFDVSVWELFWWFFNGASLYLLVPGGEKEPGAIVRALERHKITTMHFIPSMLNAFLEYIESLSNISAALKKFTGLKRVFSSGEALEVHHVERFYKLFDKIRLINLYGPTEATVDVSYFNCIKGESYKSIPIGKPIDNIRLYVVDKRLSLQPIGVSGELCIGGVGVARGYLNRPELTAEKFVEEVTGAGDKCRRRQKIYKTGDLARWQPDGNIEFLARIDFQVKIRGFRIELEEIETQLRSSDEIKNAIVSLKGHENGDKYLCAYIVTDKEIDESGLRQYLSDRLPDYMVPSHFVQLEELPFTPSGKIDRKALPVTEFKRVEDYTTPRDSVEKMIAAVWGEVLGIDRQHIAIDANFFEIGGHSLRAMSLVSKLHKTFNIKLQLSDLFKKPFIRELAKQIKNSPQHRHSSVETSEKMEHYPLSSAQKRLYILHQFDRENIGYNMPSAFLLEGEADIEKLENAFHLLIRRHESLRTSFHLVGGESRQIIREPDAFRFEIRFFHGSAEETLKRFVKPFQLEKAPLLRVGVNRLRENETLLMVNMHHIISDGVSLGILVRDFSAIYEGNLLPPLKIQYRDYSRWQNSGPVREEIARQEEYWLKRFENITPVLELPTDFNRPSVQSFEGAAVSFKIDAAAGEALNRLASRQGCTLFMAILSLYNILLAKISGCEDINIGTPVAGRRHADLESIIGIFLNILTLRSTPGAHRTFADYLPEVKEDMLETFENQDYPYEELVDNLSVNRDMSRNPLFDVMFAFQNMDIPDVELPQLKISPYRFETTASIFDMTLVANEGADGISFSIEYCSKLFKEETIDRFVNYFKNTVQWVIDNPGTRISEIEIITPGEKQQILADFNDTILDYPREKLLHELFERQAAEVPTGIASICGDRHITYGTLNEKAHRLANRLRYKGVGADSIVGLLVKRSLEMMIGILGILKAAGAYMPCDPNFPGARLDYMLQRSGTGLLLTDGGMESPPAVESEIIDIHSSLGNVDKPAIVPVKTPPARSNQLAYVIFTSGSTGNPKGIMIEHRSVVNFIEGVVSRIDFSPGTTILAITTISFDIFVLETLLPLSRGLKVAIAGEREQDDPDRLKDLILKADIDLVQLTPTRLKLLTSDQNFRFLKSIDTLMVGGETFPTDLFEHVRKIYDGKLYNMYGPTETTVWSSIKDLTASQTITIGPPIANTQLYILDKNEKIQPVGIVGELWIGGDGTARGYLDDVELNREKFALNPFIPGSRIYHTGDLARWLSGGDLEFLGRIDQQVKIRGFRIETGEIEYAMEKIDHITQAAVIPKQDAGGNNYLCAYYISNREPTVAELRKYLSDFLPVYMIPSYFVKLEMFPLTPNMKIDRNAFPNHQLKAGDRYVTPTTGVQEMAVKVWSEVLGIREENLSVDANFFELGGDSLKAIILVSKSHQVFDVKVPLPVLFKKPTIKDFSQYIEASEKGTYQPITPVEKKEYYPLSAAQMRLYVIYRMEPGSLRYNFPQAYTLEGRLDKEKLEQSFEKLIDRHRSLKTSFRMVEGQPVQKIVSQAEFHVIYHETNHREVVDFIEDFIAPFDLSAVSILRVGLVKTGENTHILILDMHHIISDYFSNEILIGELIAFYRGDSLHPLKLQYTDYSRWHRKQLESEKIKEHEEYWLEIFKDEIPVLQLPFDHPRPKSGVENNAGADINFAIKDKMFEKLTRLSNETGVTLYIVFLAIYYLLLYKYTGSEDIVIGSPAAGRGHADLESIIGVFVNILAMRNKPAGTSTFAGFLTEVKINSQKAAEHQDFQFDDLVKKLGLQRDAWKNPLFDCIFTYIDYRTGPNDEKREGEKETAPSLKITPYVVGHIESPFDLLLIAGVRKEAVSMTFTYPKALYEKTTIENMIKNYLYILQQVIENVDINISDIKLSHDLLTIESSSQRLEQVDFEFQIKK